MTIWGQIYSSTLQPGDSFDVPGKFLKGFYTFSATPNFASASGSEVGALEARGVLDNLHEAIVETRTIRLDRRPLFSLDSSLIAEFSFSVHVWSWVAGSVTLKLWRTDSPDEDVGAEDVPIPGQTIDYEGALDTTNSEVLSANGSLINLSGWLWVANDASVGNVGSGASVAIAKVERLYKVLWSNPGSLLSGGKGATAAADWSAGKVLTPPSRAGRVGIAAGNGAGLTGRALGSRGGEEAHAQTEAEIGFHRHESSSSGGFLVLRSTGTNDRTFASGSLGQLQGVGQTSYTGSSSPMNVMQPYSVVQVLRATGERA